MRGLFRLLILCIFTSVIISCGGSGSDPATETDLTDESTTPFVISSRDENPNIPPEHVGILENNTRYYATNPDGFQVSVLTNGLIGSVFLKLDEELLQVDENTAATFQSTFVAGTEVTVSIDSQPFLQECSFAGGVNSGTIQPDSTLQLQLNCIDSNTPAAPFISMIYSTAVDSINLEWENSVDRDSSANDIAYRVYWSTDRDAVENRTATFVPIPTGVVNTLINNLQTGTLYYIAIEAFDLDGNISALSNISKINTLAVPNVFTGTPLHNLDNNSISISGLTWTAPSSIFNSTPQAGDVLISDLGTTTQIARIVSLVLNSGNYVIETEEGDFSDIFSQLTIANEIGYHSSIDDSNIVTNTSIASNTSVVNTTANKTSSTIIPREKISPSLCRSTDGTTLTTEQLNQIVVEPIREFEPRVNNNLSFDVSNLSVTGDVEFVNKVTLGVKVGYELSDSVTGVFICDLAGLPRTISTFKFYIYTPTPIPIPIPIYVDIKGDIQIKVNLNAEIKAEANIQATVTGTQTAMLSYDSDLDRWVKTSTADFNYGVDKTLGYGARANARAAVIPKLTLTMQKIASIFVKADSGANSKISATGLDPSGPIAKFRNPLFPFILEEFSVDADVNVSMGADIAIFDNTILEFTETNIYSTEPLRIFDTQKICVNQGADRDNCSSYKKISQSSNEKRFELELYPVDGVNIFGNTGLNKTDISSIDWKVTPDNGHIEVNSADPRKATFVAYDDQSYTIVASATGSLGEAGRKYTTFGLSKNCQYGLGEEPPEEYQQYFVGYEYGYLFPSGLDVSDSKKDVHEICTFNDSGITSKPVVATYYAGQRNGMFMYELDVSDWDSPQLAHRVELLYQNGSMIKEKTTDTYDGYFQERVSNCIVFPNPYSQLSFSDCSLNYQYFNNYYDSTTRHLDSEKRFDAKNLIQSEINYHPNGQKSTVYNRQLKLDPNAGSNLSSGMGRIFDGFTDFQYELDEGVGAAGLVSRYWYYENGKLWSSTDYVNGIGTSCSWYKRPDASDYFGRGYFELENYPENIYYVCLDSPL